MSRLLRSLKFTDGSCCWRNTVSVSFKAFSIALFFVLWGVGNASAQTEFPCELSISCPDNVVLECGSDLDNLDLTGSPVISEVNCFQDINLIHSDDVVTQNGGCFVEILRTWTVFVIGGPSDVCTQLITVVDTQGPVFSDVPADMTYQCVADVPEQPVLDANDCNEIIDVVQFSSNTGYDTLECTLTTPIGPGPDWSVWLNGLAGLGLASGDYYRWIPGSATLNFNNDGTAYLTGNVENMVNPAETWTVHFWMENGRNWSDWSALGRSYKDDLGFGAATHQFWSYYELVPVFSHFVGTGANTGDVLYLSHQPANYYFGYQFGQGANNRNGNNGGSGWFYYTGVVNGEQVSNHGDLTTDENCVPVEHPNVVCENSYTRFWSAQDACGNVTFAQQTITVADTEAPVFSNCPEDMTVECGSPIPAAIDVADLEAIDNCLSPVTITFLGSTTEEFSACAYDITNLYEAVDTCGNRSNCSYKIHVVDTTAPELVVPGDATFECDQEIVWASATATDVCQGDVVVTEGEYSTIQDECGYHIVRTFYANDGCDNVSTGSQTIWVVDTTAPVFEEFPVQLYVECDQVDGIAIPGATDNCDETVTVTYDDILNSGGCLGVIMRTFTASDDCGNSTTAVQYITILDNTPATINEPDDMTVECDNVPEAPGAEGAEVFDNCENEVTVEFHTEMVPGECENSYTVLWIWEAWDYCENYSTDTTVVNVQDTTNPSLEVPQDATFDCTEVIVYGNASASDNCDDQVEITYSDATTEGNCPQNYYVTRTWTATDNCGNTATGTTVYTVVDMDGPVFTSVPEDITIECDEDLPLTSATAEDNCGTVTITSDDATYYQSTCLTIIIRTFVASDDCGNLTYASHLINIVDTTAPVIDYVFEIELPCDNYDGIYATATDNCSQEVAVFWVGDELASGGCLGRVIRTYGAYDDCDNYTEVQQFITLTDDVAPVIENDPADLIVECGDEIPAYTPIWSDNCDQELELSAISGISMEGCNQIISQVYTAVDHCGNQSSVDRMITIVDTTDPYFGQLPSDMTINCYDEVPAISVPTAFDVCDEVVDVEVSDDTIMGDCPNEYTIARVYRATDDCGNEAVETRYIYVVDVDAPVFGDEQINEYAYECDDAIEVIEPSASDLCGNTSLSYDDVWEVESDCFGFLIRTWTAEDDCGNQSYFNQYISIYDETAPVITGEFEIDMPCDEISQGIFVTATDNCTQDVYITIWSDELASGGCAGRIIRTYRAYDNCENWSEFTQFITLTDDVAPVASVEPVDATYECDELWVPAAVTFSDNCDQELVETANVVSETDGCTTVYHYIWTAVDHCNNATTVDQMITVTDTTAPVSNYYPEDFTVECGNFWDLVMPIFSDNCDQELTLDSGSNEEVVECTTYITYWWSATDDCGNTLYLDQVVTIEDTTPPSLVTPQGNEFSCEDEVVYGEAFAYDLCDQDVSLTYSDDTLAGNCPQSYTIVRTWVAEDNCGNTAESSAYYYVYDLTSPEFTFIPESVTIECSDEIPGSEAFASDNCDAEVTVTQSEFYYYSSECYSIILREFVATDDCGNTSTASQSIYIIDDVAPEISGDVQITMPCDDISSEILVTATDNCDQEVYIEIISEEYNSGSCAGVIERVYRAWDNCQNWSDFTQFITLVDNTAPVASVDPQDMTVECGDQWSSAVVTFTDNCDQELTYLPDLFITSDDCSMTYHYIWTAIDHCDNATTVDQYITVVDTQAPVIEDEDSEITVDCNVAVDYFIPAAYDVCDGEVDILPTFDVVQGDCDGYYTEYYTFSATDNCGHTSSVTHIVHHVDETAPILENLPEGGEYSCDEMLPTEEPTAYDYCSAAVVFSSEETLPGQCPNSYIVVRSFWAVDACGNMSDTEDVFYYIYDNTNPVFNTEVSDESYECINWDEYVAQSVGATDNCGTATVDVYISELQSDDCGNGVWMVNYTATDLCFNTNYMSYYIYVDDVTAPELSEYPSNLMLDCGDELPAATLITALDNCDQTITVNYSETCVGDCPEDGQTDCDLATPVRPALNPCNYPVDWAMALFGMPSSHKWYQLIPGSGVLHHNNDGSITVSGTLVNAYDDNGGFYFNVTFANELDWAAWSSQAFPTGFKADCGGIGANHTSWVYYILQAGAGAELTGWGTYEGSSLDLTHAPSNHYFGFQLGEGANNYNGDNGFGGWFAYHGTFLVNDEPIMSGMAAGAGDFAFTVDCCPNYQIIRCWSAMDCSGNETSWCQTISYGDLNTTFNPSSAEVSSVDESKGDIAIVNIMPNPATSKSQISFMSKETGRLSLQIMDMTGRVVADLFNNTVEAGIVYKADFDADRIPSGIYMVRLNSGTATDIDRIQITK